MANHPTNEVSGLTEADIDGFIKTRQDFIDGKITARDWQEIENELEQIYGTIK
jgi:hypothetical protein